MASRTAPKSRRAATRSIPTTWRRRTRTTQIRTRQGADGANLPAPAPSGIINFTDGFEATDTALWSALLLPSFNSLTYQGALVETTSQIEEAVAAISGEFAAIWAWDPAEQSFLAYRPSAPAQSSLAQLVPGQAIFVDLTELAAHWSLGEALTDARTVALQPGLNFIS